MKVVATCDKCGAICSYEFDAERSLTGRLLDHKLCAENLKKLLTLECIGEKEFHGRRGSNQKFIK